MINMNGFAAPSNSAFLNRRIQTENAESSEDPLFRSAFEHDRDRIIHSRAFRRLMHKTQIFNSKTNDHIRNRLTHTMEVYQISRSLGKALSLNGELIEAISLGHDLGHTPFGHVGERALHNILMGHSKRVRLEVESRACGGFKHNYQGVALLDQIEVGKPNCQGLNVTLAVREGILKHTGNKMRFGENGDKKEEVSYPNLDLTSIDVDMPSFTLEGQVVAIADEIAQCTHDLEDAYRQRIIDKEDLKNIDMVKYATGKFGIELDSCQNTNDVRMNLLYHMINMLIRDVYTASTKRISENSTIPRFIDKESCITEKLIAFSDQMQEMVNDLDSRKRDQILLSREVSIEDSKAEYIIEQIFKAYYEHPMQLPTYILERYCSFYGKQRASLKKTELVKDPRFIRLICDHIGSMTDQFAEREYRRLYHPDF